MIDDKILNLTPDSDLSEFTDDELELAINVKVAGKKLYHHAGKVGKVLWAEKKAREDGIENAKPETAPLEVGTVEVEEPTGMLSAPSWTEPAPSRLSVMEFCERVLVQQAALGTVHDSPKKVWHSMRQAYRTYVVLCETAAELGSYPSDLPQWARLGRDPDTGERVAVPTHVPPQPVPNTVAVPPPPADVAPAPAAEGGDLYDQIRREHGGSGNWSEGGGSHEGAAGFTEVKPVVLGRGDE